MGESELNSTNQSIAPLATLAHLNAGGFGFLDGLSGMGSRQLSSRILLGGPEGRPLASSSGLRGGARTFFVSVPRPLVLHFT